MTLNYTITASTCSDGIKNQDETDIDCGGSICSGCADNSACSVNSDCSSNICDGVVCVSCVDSDGDGVCDTDDPCPLDNPDDSDTDGVCNSDDCDPIDDTVYPGATENCFNAVDDDCDSFVDLFDSDCTAVCGDGYVFPPEQCDDGGESPVCDTDCTLAICGDGVFNATAGEECDDGGASATCNADCTLVTP